MFCALGIFYTPVNATTSAVKNNIDIEKMLTEEELAFVEREDNLTEEGLNDTLLLLEECGIDINNIEVNKNNLTLNVKVAGISDSIIVNSADDERIKMEVFEGEKHDVIEIDDANNLYIDNEKIEVTEEESINADEVVADAQARYGSCPYGKASDYTYYVKTTTKNLKLAKKIANYSATALGVILGSSFGIVGAVAGAVASDILRDAINSDGNILKTKAKVYYHKTKKKFMVTSSIGCQKEVTSFYGANAKKVLAKKTLWLYNHVNGA